MIKDRELTPPFQDVEIFCCDCGTPFIFLAAEQQFYYDRHLVARKRCKQCTDIRHRRYPSKGVGNNYQGMGHG
jgi:hypothetical protein